MFENNGSSKIGKEKRIHGRRLKLKSENEQRKIQITNIRENKITVDVCLSKVPNKQIGKYPL